MANSLLKLELSRLVPGSWKNVTTALWHARYLFIDVMCILTFYVNQKWVWEPDANQVCILADVCMYADDKKLRPKYLWNNQSLLKKNHDKSKGGKQKPKQNQNPQKKSQQHFLLDWVMVEKTICHQCFHNKCLSVSSKASLTCKINHNILWCMLVLFWKVANRSVCWEAYSKWLTPDM